MIILIKLLFPELENIKNLHDFFEESERGSILNSKTIADSKQVINLLRNYEESVQLMNPGVTRISAFFDDGLSPYVLNQIKTRVNPEFYNAILAASSPAMTQQESEDIFKVTEQVNMDPHKKWMIYYALATNPNTANGLLRILYDMTKGLYEYKHIVRRLVKNPNFDTSIVREEDLIIDNYTLQELKKAKRIK